MNDDGTPPDDAAPPAPAARKPARKAPARGAPARKVPAADGSRNGVSTTAPAVTAAGGAARARAGNRPAAAVVAVATKPAARPVIRVPAKPVRPRDPARKAVRRHIATHAVALVEQEARVRADEPDSVHKMRVAARRLRSGLRTFRPLLDPDWSRELAEELRWLATSLGALRDREVLLARLERDIAALPPWAAADVTLAVVRAELGRLMDAARGDALAALDSPRYAALVSTLAEAAADPPTTAAAERPCTKALTPLVAKAFRQLAEEAAVLRLDPPQVRVTAESDDAWHEARITAKKARYAAEACEPVFGKPATQLAAQLTRVTESLGEHQDAAVAAEAVIAIGQVQTVPPAAALTLGVLHGVQREAVRAARADFVAIWPEVSAKRWRAWL